MSLAMSLSAGAIITVTSTADTAASDGVCTLREAITANNTNTPSGGVAGECPAGMPSPTVDTIAFAITGGCPTVCTITPASALPVVTEPAIIDGYSQTGSSANTLAVGDNSVHRIEIDGTNAGILPGGLLEISAGNSTVRGLVINRAQGGNSAALRLITNGNNTVSGNFIGTDPTGAIARSNNCQGVTTQNSSSNDIGGLTPGDRNVISATIGCGVNLLIDSSSDNQVLNNYLGTNAAGTAALGGGPGVFVSDSSLFNIIGGTTAAARNVISGNVIGVLVADTGTSGTLIEGNFIGTDATGSSAVPNATGVEFFSSGSGNILGGTVAGAGNLIAFNSGRGVTMFGAVTPVANAVLGNSIFSNGLLGIDLNNDGVTTNDASDADTGPNGLQNFPIITAVTPGVGVTTIQGTLNSTQSSTFLLQFFSNAACDPSGNGEGQNFLGATTPGTVSTDGSGNVAFVVTVPTVVSAGDRVTGTATNLGPTPIVLSKGIRPSAPRGEIVSPGPTSEFSGCFTVLGGPTPTPTSTSTPTSTPTATVTPGGPTFTPTSTPTRTSTPTPTITPGGPTFTPTATSTSVPPSATSTVVGGGGPAPGDIPTLSGGMLALLAVALAGIALLLIRRP
jgi:CSLREA domain-containing protein